MKEIDKPRIIVNADDFGKKELVTDAIIESFEKNIIQRTTIMVNMPDCERAVKCAKSAGFFDRVGLHLNLTEGTPLTEDYRKQIRLMDGGRMSKNKIIALTRGRGFTPEETNAIKCELSAQIEKYKSYGFPLMHIDSHHHVHVEKQILEILIPVSFEFRSMRISRNLMPGDLRSRLIQIYKYYINRKIKKKFEHTDKMGSYDDFIKYYDGEDTVEIMIHPEYHNGVLCDRIDTNNYHPINDYKIVKL